LSYPVIKVASYDSRKNLCDYLDEPITLEIVIEGVVVKGHFTYINPSDYSVMIDEPFSGFEAGSHTPAIVMYKQNRNVIDGQVTDKGFRVGEKALVGIYEGLKK